MLAECSEYYTGWSIVEMPLRNNFHTPIKKIIIIQRSTHSLTHSLTHVVDPFHKLLTQKCYFVLNIPLSLGH